MSILTWHENLPKDEIPPRWMWGLDHELERWWAEVDQKRDEKYGSGDKEAPNMMRNTLAPSRR